MKFMSLRFFISWRLCLTYLLLLISFILNAEEPFDFKTVDAKTYKLYSVHSWKELVNYGNKAIANGIDYYYLRVRIGTAYYELKNYRKAIHHFEKALKFNIEEEPQEYLYYSYLFSGRESDANNLAAGFSDALKQNLHIKNVFNLASIYAEYGNIFSNNDKLNNNIDIDGNENIYGESMRRNEGYFFHLGLKSNFGGRFDVYTGA